jgi:hypothetical protein
MPIIAVHYRFFDRKTSHTGEGEAVVHVHQGDFDPDLAEHRSYLESHLAQAVAKEYSEHQEHGLTIIIVSTSTLEELRSD